MIITAIILLNPKRDALACSFAVPYILIGPFIFVTNISLVPAMFYKVFTFAFTGDAVLGATLGTAISQGL